VETGRPTGRDGFLRGRGVRARGGAPLRLRRIEEAGFGARNAAPRWASRKEMPSGLPRRRHRPRSGVPRAHDRAPSRGKRRPAGRSRHQRAGTRNGCRHFPSSCFLERKKGAAVRLPRSSRTGGRERPLRVLLNRRNGVASEVVFDSLGGFDETFPGRGLAKDVELAYRGSRGDAGRCRLVYSPRGEGTADTTTRRRWNPS